MTTTIDHDLVTSDYYKQEIEYQDKIDMKTNLAKSGMHVSVLENGNEIHVSVPVIGEKSIENAEVYFYRPSDETKDLKLNKHQNGTFIIPNNQLVKGEYVIKTEWTIEGVKYYEEINFTKS
jgi:nitrogen fixation protein FixH